MRFHDRRDAGIQLATALERYRDHPGIVFPLPRGGVTLGVEVARALQMPLDLIVPRKIGHPANPEYAICAVAECGELLCNEAERARVDPDWLRQQVEREQHEARRRRAHYMDGREPLNASGATAILVDDGIATGLTMEAAIRDARQRNAATIVVAIPVVPPDTYRRLKTEVDDVVALEVPEVYRGAVGAYYDDFEQVTDAEVIVMLEDLRREQLAARH
ncbi:phosphoribosyltransferase [Marinobacterium nitratireducens]|uniref:Phosphoribosyltransferase n=1 Tax=Marinobacterium nitratireducens TaxID=518897 RepID=A0A918DPV3_9GAMM|nr:phosphoribosyltransferase family protein [Marinobacterium nitratireducens]GGO76992.1 phosphoribosyltransferase [Marinobacterium nitratireducens]